MASNSAFIALGISLGLGLLVGLQRERSQSSLAGIRTFPLVTLLGTLAALASRELGGWFPAAGMLSIMGAILVGNRVKPTGETPSGITTEIALLVMYAVGVELAIGPISIGIAVGGAVTLLLNAKDQLHAFVARLGDKDVRAIMQFSLIALVILPIVPDEDMGPYGVLNPRNIWLVVVLVVGISLAGYVAYRLAGARSGAIISGILGGMVSSTATTVSYSRRAAEAPDSTRVSALVIVLATAVVYARVLAEIFAVTPEAIWDVAPPILVMGGVAVASALFMVTAARGQDTQVPEPRNPSQLRTALLFAALYSVVLIAVTATKRNFGDTGLYVAAAISGLTDMDAITLSTARMVHHTQLHPIMAGKIILIAAMANLVFKSGIVAFLGGRRLFKPVAILFAAQIATGVILLAMAPLPTPSAGHAAPASSAPIDTVPTPAAPTGPGPVPGP